MIEAMKLALKAFEVATTPLARDRQEVLRAQAALRQAIEQAEEKNCKNCVIDKPCIAKGKDMQICGAFVSKNAKELKQIALEKKAENARELGLDYEPTEIPIEETLKRAYYFDEHGKWRGSDVSEWQRWHGVAKAAKQAEKQEPVEMPTIKFSQVADGIEVGYDLFGGVDIRLGGEFVYVHINYNYKYTDNATRTHLANSIVELLTNKPQREWVGLTDEEIDKTEWVPLPKTQITLDIGWIDNMKVFARAIEAKLKEKNGWTS